MIGSAEVLLFGYLVIWVILYSRMYPPSCVQFWPFNIEFIFLYLFKIDKSSNNIIIYWFIDQRKKSSSNCKYSQHSALYIFSFKTFRFKLTRILCSWKLHAKYAMNLPWFETTSQGNAFEFLRNLNFIHRKNLLNLLSIWILVFLHLRTRC